MKRRKMLCSVLVFVGIVIGLYSAIGFTGLVVAGEDSGLKNLVRIGGVIGVLFIVIGGILIELSRNKEGGLEKLSKRERKIKQRLKQELDSSRIGSYNDLEKYAKKLGLRIEDGRNHSIVYKGDEKITTIPRHAHGEATGTYRSILKEIYRSIG